MGIFNDNMYTIEEVTRIKEIYQDIGWLIRDFQETPANLRGVWTYEYDSSLYCFKDYELEIIAHELTKCFQKYGYKVKYQKTEIFYELYTVEVEVDD